ncbi:MAG: hypothetical protein QXT25_04625 [Candidatus Anstonellaceae archaeon]
MFRVLVFGNPLALHDSAAIKIARKLSSKIKDVEFVHFDTSEDLEKEGDKVAILDVVVGLKEPRIVKIDELELSDAPLSLHGFDLAWNLLLLKKIGKLKEAVIIGVPPTKPLSHIQKVEKLIRKLAGSS